MLQRLYGMVAESPAAMEAELARIEEAKKRDHRKLGRELELFSVSDDIGPGLILWHPKLSRVRVVVEDYWRREHFRAGYEMIFTPHMGRAHLWETSGHLSFYKDSMYPPMEIVEDGEHGSKSEPYYIKPMNCPFHIQIYNSRRYSYRDLPLRWAELGTVYRFEKEGVRHGMMRARGFTQDDAHIFCTPDQIVSEIRRTVNFCLGILRSFGFNDVTAFLSTRPAKAVGEVLPQLKGKLDGSAIRVPTPNVSVVDLTFESARPTTKSEVNQVLAEAAAGELKGVLDFTVEPLVSIDFNHSPASSTVDSLETAVIGGNMVRVLTWYDNEWGFSNRMADTAVAMGKFR
jgi:hypothetical protein